MLTKGAAGRLTGRNHVQGPDLVVSHTRPGAFRSIGQALDAAGPDVVVWVEPGTYAGQLNAVRRTVWVRPSAGPGTVTLESNDGYPVVYAEHARVTLHDLTLTAWDQNTNSTVEAVGGTLEMSGCTFVGQAATGVLASAGARA